MTLALECLRAGEWGDAYDALGAGGEESTRLWRDANSCYARVHGDRRILFVRVALALRVLLRIDEHAECDAHTSCCSSVGVWLPCPYVMPGTPTGDGPADARRVAPLWESAPAHEVAR